MPWRQKWHTLRRFSRQDWRWFLTALGLLPLVAGLVQGLGLKRTQALLARCAPVVTAPRLSRDRVPRLAAMVMLGDRYSRPWSNCLRRSLVLAYLLR